MNILVTGGAGRIGSHVISLLLARGDRVINLDLRESGQAGVTNIIGAFDDAAAVARATEKAEAVLHLGALMSWVAADAPKMFAANVTGTSLLLQAAQARKVKKFVFASSGEVYPETKPAYLPIDESHPTQPTSAYGMTKLLAEEAVKFYSRSGLAAVILRFSHTQDAAELLDPESFFSGPRFYLRARIRQQEAFGNMKVVETLRSYDDGTEKHLVSRGQDGVVFRMPISDARDIAAGVIAALDSDRADGQVMNLGVDEAIRFDEAVALLQKHTGLPAVDVRFPVPAVNYATSRARAIEILGVRPQWTFQRMVEDAAARRN
ncbi:MAG: nucleoside-diphosphate sugar epimerase [Rhizobiales bacterium 65-9]|nr:NAD(P)-dependent oxidoreductase [Hyphomicrobiales bacterium]OJY35496.1 MAG: nucleoside-diphosphate sugar epimerase [Rhizobiales bacterium 65-9]